MQDLGRDGYGPLGVSPCGAADPVALRLGNRVLGNADGAAALEMTLHGGTFLFPDGGVIAIAGSDFGATLDMGVVPLCTALEVQHGETLTFGPTRTGARCYLCVQGGFQVAPVLGSMSTHILSGIGGLYGRPLKRNDVITLGERAEKFREYSVPALALEHLAPRKILRVTSGPQADWFEDSPLFSAPYQVTEEANRMGLRLQGEKIAAPRGRQMITEGVALGAIQVPAAGQPIILFVDQQTTGGYPKIANVIAADLASIGQLRPRDEVRFELVDMDTAVEALRQQEALLASIGSHAT